MEHLMSNIHFRNKYSLYALVAFIIVLVFLPFSVTLAVSKQHLFHYQRLHNLAMQKKQLKPQQHNMQPLKQPHNPPSKKPTNNKQ